MFNAEGLFETTRGKPAHRRNDEKGGRSDADRNDLGHPDQAAPPSQAIQDDPRRVRLK